MKKALKIWIWISSTRLNKFEVTFYVVEKSFMNNPKQIPLPNRNPQTVVSQFFHLNEQKSC